MKETLKERERYGDSPIATGKSQILKDVLGAEEVKEHTMNNEVIKKVRYLYNDLDDEDAEAHFMLYIDLDKYPKPDIKSWCRCDFQFTEWENNSEEDIDWDDKMTEYDAISREDMLVIINHGFGSFYTYSEDFKSYREVKD